MPLWKWKPFANLFRKKATKTKPKNPPDSPKTHSSCDSLLEEPLPGWDTLMRMPINELDTALTMNPLWLARLSEKDTTKWDEFGPRLTAVQRWRKLVRMTNAQFYKQVIVGSWGVAGGLFGEVMDYPELSDKDRQLLSDKIANAILDLPSAEFLQAMRTGGLDDRWTDCLYNNGDDEFIERVIRKNNEAGVHHNLSQTRKCMIEFLEQNQHFVRHPDGLLFWARESEKRAEALQELRDDEEALRKYLVVNEPQQKFLELWRMSQIQVLRQIKEHPTDVFVSVSARGVRSRSRAGTMQTPCRLETIMSRQESHASILDTIETLKAPVNLNEVSQRRSSHVSIPSKRRGSVYDRTLEWARRSRKGSVYDRTRSRNGSVTVRDVKWKGSPPLNTSILSSRGTPFSRSRGGSIRSPIYHSKSPLARMTSESQSTSLKSVFSLTRKNSYREYIYSQKDSGRSTPSELP